MYRFLIILIWLSITLRAPAAAQSPLKASKAVLSSNRPDPFTRDSSKLNIRKFDGKKIDTYRKQAAFDYDKPAAGQNLWSRFWAWIWNLINSLFKGSNVGSFPKYLFIFLKYLATAIAVGLVVFIVLKFIGIDMKVFSRKSKSVPVPYHESADNIHEIDFSTAIEDAIAAGNYRLAVRLLYLQVLKRLNDQNLISWQPEKTNHTYISEIADPDKRKQFALLTRQFEYIWYGEFFIDKENFRQVKDTYDTFNRGTV